MTEPAVAIPAPAAAQRDPASFSIGVVIRSIRAEPVWWLESAVRLDRAGYAGLWCWDHFMGRGDLTVPVVESWTILSMAAARTTRTTVAPFVANVMNRHPAVLARMAGTLQIASGGRLILGIGIGGAPREHASYGIPFPEAPERVHHLVEAVATIRALWTGGPVSRASDLYPLENATAYPVPDPAPRIVIGGESRNGARLSARIGDGWSTFDDNFSANLPLYLETLEAEGRRRDDQLVLCGFQGDWLGDADVAETEWVREPRAARERWAEAGADGAIVLARSTSDVDALVDAVGRW
jgi:alkanesulfonate monooxygenase SsuD/methylene tetrahydromethanopterin reductase-like flavin-dependent oxidoreductase (luciferase family)